MLNLRLSLHILIWLTIGLVIVASLLGLVRYRDLSPGQPQQAGFDALMELLSVSFVLLQKTNLFLLPFITIGELTFLALAYRQALQSSQFSRGLPWLLGLLSAYALLESGLQFGVVRYAVSLGILNDLIQLGLAGLYFRKLLNELRVEHLRADPFFGFSVALAVHGLGDLLIALFSSYLLAHGTPYLQDIIFLGVRNTLNFFFYAAYCLALWMRPLKSNLSSS